MAPTTANPFTAPWPSASLTRPRQWSSRPAPLPCRARPLTPRPVSATSTSGDPGQGAPGLAKGGRLRQALARRNRRVPVQDHHRSWPPRPDTAGPEDRSPGRLLGAQPDDPARYAAVTAHRLKARPTTALRPLPELRTKALASDLARFCRGRTLAAETETRIRVEPEQDAG